MITTAQILSAEFIRSTNVKYFVITVLVHILSELSISVFNKPQSSLIEHKDYPSARFWQRQKTLVIKQFNKKKHLETMLLELNMYQQSQFHIRDIYFELISFAGADENDMLYLYKLSSYLEPILRSFCVQ